MHPILYVCIYARAFSHTAVHPVSGHGASVYIKAERDTKLQAPGFLFLRCGPRNTQREDRSIEACIRRLYRINTRRKKKRTLKVSASIYRSARNQGFRLCRKAAHKRTKGIRPDSSGAGMFVSRRGHGPRETRRGVMTPRRGPTRRHGSGFSLTLQLLASATGCRPANPVYSRRGERSFDRHS